MSELPDECEFCDRTLDDGEDLVPIYAGKPDVDADAPVGATYTHTERTVVEYVTDEIYASEEVTIAKALEQIETVNAEVMTPEMIVNRGRVVADDIGGQAMFMGKRLDSGSAGVTVEVKLPLERIANLLDVETVMPEPDIEVCGFCREAFTGGSDDD